MGENTKEGISIGSLSVRDLDSNDTMDISLHSSFLAIRNITCYHIKVSMSNICKIHRSMCKEGNDITCYMLGYNLTLMNG